MVRLLVLLALSAYLEALEALELPEVIAVTTVTTHVEIDLDTTVRTWTTHDIVLMSKSTWVAKYGPLTDLDEREYWQFGCLRRSQVLNHYSL
jgi:hypothetical protein